MPATNYGELQQIQTLFGKVNSPNPSPAAYVIGLLPVDLVWTASTPVNLNQYCVATNFNTSNGTPCRAIFKATSISGTGTTGSSQPSAWTAGTQTAGATYTDNSGANQIVWTECTNLFFNTSGTTPYAFAGPEVAASAGYYRQLMLNTQGTSSWVTPSLATVASTGTSTTWGSDIIFGTSTASWKNLAAYILYDAPNTTHSITTGTALSAILSTAITVASTTSFGPTASTGFLYIQNSGGTASSNYALIGYTVTNSTTLTLGASILNGITSTNTVTSTATNNAVYGATTSATTGASTLTNVWSYGLLNSYLSILSSGIQVKITAAGTPVTVTLT